MPSTDIEESVKPKLVILLLLIGGYNGIVSINHTLPTFHGYTPRYFCQVDNVSATVEGCVIQLNSSIQNDEPSCPQGYQFQSERGDSTVVTEWELVCERRFLRPMIATVYFCGVTIGAILCGLLADLYGRRLVLLTCLYIQGLLGAILSLTTSLGAFMTLRFIQGFFLQGMQGATFTLAMELFPPKSRTAVATVIEMYWSIGMMFLAGASYCVAQWRPLQLVLSVPTAATLLYVCLVPESPRWLATQTKGNKKFMWIKVLHDKMKFVPFETVNSNQIVNEIKTSDKKESCEISEKNTNTNNLQQEDNSNFTKQQNESPCNETYTADQSDLCAPSDECAKKMKGDIQNCSMKQKEDRENIGNKKLVENVASVQGTTVVDNMVTVHTDITNALGFNNAASTSHVGKEKGDRDDDINASKMDELNNLWKEIFDELGYDGDKSSLDTQEIPKESSKTSGQYEEIVEHCLDNTLNANSISDADSVVEEYNLSCQLKNSSDNRLSLVDQNNFIPLQCNNITCYNSLGRVKTDNVDLNRVSSTTTYVFPGSNDENQGTKNKKANLLDLYKKGTLRKYNFIMILVWFSVALLYYGLMFHLPSLSGERHLNFFLGALLECFSFIVVYFIVSKFGRRLPLASFSLVASFCCLVVGAVSVVPEEDVYWIGNIQTTLALLGKSCAVAAFGTMFLFASELFPTVLRAAAMGHCGFWARIGSLIAPQIIYLGEYTLTAVPLIIMGLLGMMAGMSVFALPETLGRQLPDTVEEVELFAQKMKSVQKTRI